MARNISVKVPTIAIIEQIESKLAQIDKDIEDYPARRAQFDKDTEAYKKNVANFMSDYLVKNIKKIGYDYDSVIRINDNSWGRVEVTFDPSVITDFPKRPEAPVAPNQKESFGREYVTQKSLLEKNLRILKLTTQEEVNASTYGAIVEIL